MAKPRVRVNTRGEIIGGPPAMGAWRGQSSTRAYDAARTDTQELSNWLPSLSAVNDEVIGGRDRIVARVRDLERNNAWAAGGIDKRVDAVVGPDLWLSLKPNWRALGLSAEWAATWASEVEAKFRLWAEEATACDLEMALPWGGLIELAYRHYALEDEAFAIIYYRQRAGMRYGTRIRIVDPDLVCNPSTEPEREGLRGGVETNRDGAAVAYHFQLQHPNESVVTTDKTNRWVRVPRFTRSGRSQVIHAYRKKRAGQLRGVSRLAAALKRFKQLDRYDDGELNAALLSTLIPLFIKSTSPANAAMALAPADDDGSEDPFNNMAARAAFHESSKITFNGLRIPVLYDNEDIASVDTKRPNSNFAAFEAAVLRSLAGSFGLSYEQLSNDWGNVNYSSARAALIEIWRGMMNDRTKFTRAFCTPLFAAWLEEAILLGDVQLPAGAPSFYEARAAYTACRWIGPGRGWVDPVKEAEAAAVRMRNGLSTLEDEAAEQGADYRDNIDARARIRAEVIAAGLPDPEMEPAPMPSQTGPRPQRSGGDDQREAA